MISSGPDGAVDAALADAGGKKSLTGGPCRSREDCQLPQDLCREPAVGPHRGGGGDAFSCRQECESDQQCAQRSAGSICLTNPVGSGCRTCQPGCAQLACDIGQSCQSDGRCLPTACRLDGDCPPNFTCGPQGACARVRCRGDDECQGACVNGACHPTPGSCTMISA